MNIGKNKETFEIFLKEEYFKNDIIKDNSVDIEIIDIPKLYYNKWYYRALNILTFKIFFNRKLVYTIKILKNESRNN